MSIVSFNQLQNMLRKENGKYKELTASIKSYKEQLTVVDIPANVRCSLKLKLKRATQELQDLKSNIQEEAESLVYIDLQVPYHDKETAKYMGAKWDRINKTWYIDITEVDMDLFTEYMPLTKQPSISQDIFNITEHS